MVRRFATAGTTADHPGGDDVDRLVGGEGRVWPARSPLDRPAMALHELPTNTASSIPARRSSRFSRSARAVHGLRDAQSEPKGPRAAQGRSREGAV